MSVASTNPLLRACAAAVRHGDAGAVKALLASATSLPTLLNVPYETEAATASPHEIPTYPTLLLIEACRSRSREVVDALLQAPTVDVNATALRTRSTAFADCCARGDAGMAQFLLQQHSQLDASLGDECVAHPAVYGSLTGNLDVLRVFTRGGLVDESLEALLIDAAEGSGHAAAAELVRDHAAVTRPLRALTPALRARKIRLACLPVAVDVGGVEHIPLADLGPVAAAVGFDLSSSELAAAAGALAALPTARVGGDRRQLVPVEAVIALWVVDGTDADAPAAADAAAGAASSAMATA